MNTMKVVAGKLSDESVFCKFVYEKNNKLYVRGGEDNYKTGILLQSSLEGAYYKWGYYKVENPPIFHYAEDFVKNISNFSLTSNRTIRYHENLI